MIAQTPHEHDSNATVARQGPAPPDVWHSNATPNCTLAKTTGIGASQQNVPIPNLHQRKQIKRPRLTEANDKFESL